MGFVVERVGTFIPASNPEEQAFVKVPFEGMCLFIGLGGTYSSLTKGETIKIRQNEYGVVTHVWSQDNPGREMFLDDYLDTYGEVIEDPFKTETIT